MKLVRAGNLVTEEEGGLMQALTLITCMGDRGWVRQQQGETWLREVWDHDRITQQIGREAQ